MISVGILKFWDVFLLFKFDISFCISSIETSLKQKFIWAFFYSWISRILGWFLYFRIALIMRFSTLSIDGSYSLYFVIIRFLITFPKKLLKVSAVSNSVLTTSLFSVKYILSLVTILSENEGFIVFQRVHYPLNFFRLSFHNTFFWMFVVVISLESSFVNNGIWFPLVYIFFTRCMFVLNINT